MTPLEAKEHLRTKGYCSFNIADLNLELFDIVDKYKCDKTKSERGNMTFLRGDFSTSSGEIGINTNFKSFEEANEIKDAKVALLDKDDITQIWLYGHPKEGNNSLRKLYTELTKYFYDIPYKVLNDNILINQNLLLACQNSGVKKIIYTSSSEIYGPTPITPTSENEPIVLHSLSNRYSYASSKAFGEFQIRIWCEQNGIDWLILRPFNTYGPRMVSGGYGQVIPELIQRMKEEHFYIFLPLIFGVINN